MSELGIGKSGVWGSMTSCIFFFFFFKKKEKVAGEKTTVYCHKFFVSACGLLPNIMSAAFIFCLFLPCAFALVLSPALSRHCFVT